MGELIKFPTKHENLEPLESEVKYLRKENLIKILEEKKGCYMDDLEIYKKSGAKDMEFQSVGAIQVLSSLLYMLDHD